MLKLTAVLFVCLLAPFMVFAQTNVLPEFEASSLPSLPDTEPAWDAIVIALFIGGFIFLFIEVALIPGFGFVGITGIIFLIIAAVLAFVKLTLIKAVVLLSLSVIFVIIGMLWLFLVFPKTSAGKGFILDADFSKDEYVAVDDKSALIGREALTITVLRPAGFVKLDEERIEVSSDCAFIEKGKNVKIVSIKNNRLIVAEIEKEPKE